MPARRDRCTLAHVDEKAVIPQLPMNKTDDARLDAALLKSIKLLEDAVREQEKATVRIIGLAERLRESAASRPVQLQADGIIESCGFQDVTGQGIRRVIRFLRYLREGKTTVEAIPEDMSQEKSGTPPLTQAQIDRMLAEKRR